MDDLIKNVTIDVWPAGIDNEDMAEEMKRISKLISEGYREGEVLPRPASGNEGGWWKITVA